MKIEWSRVTWLDVSLHVAVAIVWMVAAWFTPFAAAFAVAAVFWFREAGQRNPYELRPWLWGIGAQMEFYAPALAALLMAVALQIGSW